MNAVGKRIVGKYSGIVSEMAFSSPKAYCIDGTQDHVMISAVLSSSMLWE
jgi:hypothetical protein